MHRSDPYLLAYFKEIGRTPLLTKRQEKTLARRRKRGDKEAIKQLVSSNLCLVAHIAKKYASHHVPMADLINSGNLGLIRAAELYDDRFSSRFGTYAGYWIKQSISLTLNKRHIINIPPYVSQLVKRAARVAEGTNDRQLTKQEIKLLGKTKLPSIDNDADISILMGQQSDEAAEPDELNKLSSAIANLPPIEAKIIRMRFGIQCEQMTLNEISKIFKLSGERVRQIEGMALNRLRSMFKVTQTCR